MLEIVSLFRSPFDIVIFSEILCQGEEEAKELLGYFVAWIENLFRQAETVAQ